MPKLVKGEGSINELAGEIKKAGYNSVFFIAGRHFFNDHNTDFLQGLSVTSFIKSGANVDAEEGEKAFQQYSENSRQAIVAIGGGSVMDIAKYIIYRRAETFQSIPFFAVAPTTAGSGSEATQFAVIYKQKKKFSLVHPSMLAELIVLDSELTATLSSYQAAVSGMDVFAQAIESYWNVNATDASRKFAEESIILWKKFFIKAVKNPDTESREGMMEAAYLAGKAINITRTTGPHALSYYLTANKNVPHGQAVALFLPVFFFYNQPQVELCELLNVKDEKAAAEMIWKAMKDAGLATNLKELDIKKEQILDDLLNEVNEERFANNPAKFDKEKLKQLITDYL